LSDCDADEKLERLYKERQENLLSISEYSGDIYKYLRDAEVTKRLNAIVMPFFSVLFNREQPLHS
jgi:hypothetical protein